MALLFCDGFDHYNNLLDKGWIINGGNPFIVAGGRAGSGSLRFGKSRQTREFPTLPSTVIAGFALRSAYSFDQTIFYFQYGGTSYLYLTINSLGQLTVYGPGYAYIGSSVVGAIPINVYKYIEIKDVISATVGSIELRIDGISVFSVSGINTCASGPEQITSLQIGSGADIGAIYWDLDDLYVCDGTGALNNDFLGDVRVQAIYPSGNGTTSNLVGSDGNSTDNYALVDEVVPDGADYVESSTVGDKDTYAYGDLGVSGIVHGVQILPLAVKTDGGIRSITSVARVSGTEEDGASQPLSMSYTYFPDMRNTKPGGGAWTVSDVNSAEFGVKITA